MAEKPIKDIKLVVRATLIGHISKGIWVAKAIAGGGLDLLPADSNKYGNTKEFMKTLVGKIIQWLLFLPLGYLIFVLSFFAVFVGVSFLIFLASEIAGLSFFTKALLLMLAFSAIPIILWFTLLLYLGASTFAKYISPTKKAYFFLGIIYTTFKIRDFISYYSLEGLPDTPNVTTVQMPLILYLLIVVFQVAVIFIYGLVMSNEEESPSFLVMKKQSTRILDEEIDPKYYPNLYRMAKRNPEGLAEQLQSIANTWHEGSITSAMQALESDLAHG